MTTSSVSQSKLTYSSRKDSCPVCGRTKDADCRWNIELCHCRTYAKHHLARGEVVHGSDGRQWAYLGPSGRGIWALFRPHEERRDNRTPKLSPSAKQTLKPAISPPPAKKPRPTGQREFIYHDADGKPLIRVTRVDDEHGKRFHQFRWENGQWVAGLTEQVTRQVRLYRIAEARVLARETGHPVFLVEGEKCADRLMGLGIPATTSIGGAGKWSGYGGQNYLQDLQGCQVVLCPDADFCGLKHMVDVERSLRSAGIEIAGWLLAPPDAPWDDLPKGGGLDVVDWLENGATAEDILNSVRVSLPDYLVAEDENTDSLAEGDDTRKGKKKSVAIILIELALKLGTLWHDSTGAGWVDFRVDGNLQTARIRSKRFRDFLSQVLLEKEHRSASSEAWSEAVGTLEGLARFKCPQREVFLRVGKHEGSIYIDLGTEDWRVVRVSPDGWDIIPYAECPIRFYRSDCQKPLPIPTRGGSLADLWRLLNVKESDRPLVLGWLLSCLTPDGSKPILTFSGEKGSGKSTAASLLKRLTDPTEVDMVGGVENQRQFAVSAANRWVLCFDNLTHLSTEQQNLLCRASTGGGFTYRALYTDLDEVTVKYRRPQILTGVDLVPTRGDLLDRCLIVRLERISEENRLSERKLKELTEKVLPGIYGALLDLMVVALRNLPTITLDELPRMADFAELCAAAGIPDFVEAYSSNIELGNQAAVEANPIAEGIVSLLDAHDGYWHGTATELIRQLQELDPTNKLFQKISASSIGKKLVSSLKTDLDAVGVKVDHGRTGSQRYLILSRVSEPQKPMTQSPPVSSPSLDKEEEQPTQTSAPSLDKAEEQPIPTAPQTPTPVQNNGAAVPSAPARPEEKKTPATALQPNNSSRLQRTTNGTPPTSKQEDPYSRWRSLFDACVKAEVSHLQVREVLAEACGISKKDVGEIPLTSEQYRRALLFLASYKNRATANGSSPPSTSTQTRLPVSPPRCSTPNGNGHSLDSAEIGLPLAYEGVPPWQWEG